MPAVVKLTDLIDALNIQNDEIFSFLDTQTGKVVMISRDEMQAVETGVRIDGYPDWQQELMKEAQAVVEDEAGRYLELPTQFEVNEYAIMEKFCLSVADPQISNDLYYAIKGSGAFRRFKNKIQQHGLAEAWYKYRNRAFADIARSWCQENNIECH